MNTATQTNTTTPATELRTAAATLREMAKNASRGPWHIGDCELYPRWILSDGEAPEGGYAEDVARIAEDEADAFRVSDADWHWMAFAHPGIAEPLAVWLEQTAKNYSDDVYKDDIGCNPGQTLGTAHCESDCPGHKPLTMCDRCGNQLNAPDLIRCHCWDSSLAVARAINGGTR